MKVFVELVDQTRRILHVTTKLLYSRTWQTIPRYICICVPLKRRPMLNPMSVINSLCKTVLICHVSVLWLSHTFRRDLSCSIFQDGSDDVKDSSIQKNILRQKLARKVRPCCLSKSTFFKKLRTSSNPPAPACSS